MNFAVYTSFEAPIGGLGTEKAEAHIRPRSEGRGEKERALWMLALYERYCGLTGVGCSGRGRLAIKASTIPNMRPGRSTMDGWSVAVPSLLSLGREGTVLRLCKE